jgi:hypothetical protein
LSKIDEISPGEKRSSWDILKIRGLEEDYSYSPKPKAKIRCSN